MIDVPRPPAIAPAAGLYRGTAYAASWLAKEHYVVVDIATGFVCYVAGNALDAARSLDPGCCHAIAGSAELAMRHVEKLRRGFLQVSCRTGGLV